MQSSIVIVIELWCCGPAALMKCIKIQSLLAEGIGSEKGYKVGRLSLLVEERGRKSKGINNGIRAN